MSFAGDDLDDSWSGLWADWISEDLIAVRQECRLHVHSISNPQTPPVGIDQVVVFEWDVQLLVSNAVGPIATNQEQGIVVYAVNVSGCHKISYFNAQTSEGGLVFEPEVKSICTALALSSDGALVAASFYQQNAIELLIWSMKDNCKVASVALDSCVIDIQARPSEVFEFLALDEDEEITIYKVVNHWDGVELKKQDLGINHWNQTISAYCWTPTGLVASGDKGALFLYSTDGINKILELGQISNGELISAISCNGETLVAGGPSGCMFQTRIHVNNEEVALDGVSQVNFEKIPISELRFGHNCSKSCLLVSAEHLYLVTNLEFSQSVNPTLQKLALIGSTVKEEILEEVYQSSNALPCEHETNQDSSTSSLALCWLKDHMLTGSTHTEDPLFQKLTDLVENLKRCKYSNSRAKDIEKLTDEELVLDKELEDSFRQEGKIEVGRVEDTAKEIIGALANLKHEIKTVCWDSFDVHAFGVASLRDHTLFVESFQIKLSTEDERQLEKATIFKRKTDEFLNDQDKQIHHSSDTTSSSSLNETEALLYNDTDLTTIGRKQEQITLLSMYTKQLKERFNAKIQCLTTLKSKHIEKLQDANNRTREILEILKGFGKIVEETDYMVHPYQDSNLENPEEVLLVKDEDVKYEKYISSEDLKKAQEANAKMKELASQAERGIFARGLKEMMNGSLDRPTVPESDLTVERPDWVETQPEHLTDEQRKEVLPTQHLDHEEESKAKREAQLESELRTLQQTKQALLKEFDVALLDLKKERKDTLWNILKAELEIALLKKAIFETRINSKHLDSSLMQALAISKDQGNNVSKSIENLNGSLLKQKERCGKLTLEARQVDRAFYKEFPKESPSQTELLKWFKWRGSMEDMLRPERVSPSNWTRMTELRQRRLNLERELESEECKLSNMQAQLESLHNDLAVFEMHIQEGVDKINRLKRLRQSLAFDGEVVREMVLGTLEIQPAHLSRNFSHALLLDKSVMDQLNEAILANGKRKVSVLEEIKNFKKGIYVLQWETKALDLKVDDVIERTKEIQLLRIDKETRRLMTTEESPENKKRPSRAKMLEKSVGPSSTEKKLKEKEALLHQLRHQVSTKKRENERLRLELDDLEDSTQVMEEETQNNHSAKIDDMIADKKLKDLAQKQQAQIHELKSKLEKWYTRTFPKFPTTT